jgi:hypothetical protein
MVRHLLLMRSRRALAFAAMIAAALAVFTAPVPVIAAVL